MHMRWCLIFMISCLISSQTHLHGQNLDSCWNDFERLHHQAPFFQWYFQWNQKQDTLITTQEVKIYKKDSLFRYITPEYEVLFGKVWVVMVNHPQKQITVRHRTKEDIPTSNPQGIPQVYKDESIKLIKYRDSWWFTMQNPNIQLESITWAFNQSTHIILQEICMIYNSEQCHNCYTELKTNMNNMKDVPPNDIFQETQFIKQDTSGRWQPQGDIREYQVTY